MIVWGGADVSGNYFNTGGRYDPGTDSWTATNTTNAPSARYAPAVWTGSEMIVWGGFDGSNVLNTGGRYNPGTDTWTATSPTNAPDPRGGHTAVWTGTEMIVWGEGMATATHSTQVVGTIRPPRVGQLPAPITCQLDDRFTLQSGLALK